MNTAEVIRAQCVCRFVLANAAGGRCPNCGEPAPSGTATPPPLPGSRRAWFKPLLVGSWIGVVLLVVLAPSSLDSAKPSSLVILAVVFAANYAGLSRVMKNPFGRLFGALFVVRGIVAVILGVLYAGWVLIMKGFS